MRRSSPVHVVRMRKNYDFSKARRGRVVQQPGKTRISIYLDDGLLTALRESADAAGRSYQTMIEEALREFLARSVAARAPC